MTRSRLLFFCVSSLLVATIVGGGLLAASEQEGPGEDSLYKYLSVFSEVLSLSRQAYVEEVQTDTLMTGALDGVTEALDPFSLYLPETEVERYLTARERGTRMSGLTLLKDRGIAFAAAVEPGSPADEAGVKVSDIVTQIDGRSTRLMPVWEIQEILGADAGTPVELDLLRRGEPERATLVLERFAPPPAGMTRLDDGLGVVQVGGLLPSAETAIRATLEEAAKRNEDRLLLDLRGVAGGDVDTAYGVAGMLAAGELGRLDRRGESLETFEAEGEPLWQGRLVVLVDRGTLGAAEVLATVLRQKVGAELVGERTFGHAGRQALAELSSGGRLVYTDAFYTGPDGEPLVESLEPDVNVSERSRRFAERDVPVHELILREGADHLRAEPEEEAEPDEAAA